MPSGPRIHTDPTASAIVVDGRMFVAGGFADPVRPTPPDVPLYPSPTPCPPPADGDPEGSADGEPSQEPDCRVLVRSSQDGPDEAAAGGAASSGPSSYVVGPEVPATGAAWLDLATGTWEEVQLPVDDDVLPHAVRPDALTAPTTLELTPRHPVDGSYWRLDAAGELFQFQVSELPFLDDPFLDPVPDLRFTRIDLDGNGDPAFAVATRIDRPRWPDRPVAVPDAGGDFVEATIREPLAGVTYALIDGQLHAFGGIPYQAERDENGRIVSDLTYDFEQPLFARVLQR